MFATKNVYHFDIFIKVTMLEPKRFEHCAGKASLKNWMEKEKTNPILFWTLFTQKLNERLMKKKKVLRLKMWTKTTTMTKKWNAIKNFWIVRMKGMVRNAIDKLKGKTFTSNIGIWKSNWFHFSYSTSSRSHWNRQWWRRDGIEWAIRYKFNTFQEINHFKLFNFSYFLA